MSTTISETGQSFNLEKPNPISNALAAYTENMTSTISPTTSRCFSGGFITFLVSAEHNFSSAPLCDSYHQRFQNFSKNQMEEVDALAHSFQHVTISTHEAENKVAGGEESLRTLRELIVWPEVYREEAKCLGVEWPRGLLLHGPPGCGKTLMVQAVCEEAGAAVHSLTASDVFGAYVGESERKLRDAFEAAANDAQSGKTAVIFIDEIDSLCPKRSGQKPHETRVVSQLLTLIDGVASPESLSQNHTEQDDSASGRVVVVGATNRPNAIDPALRRPGRLDREVAVSVPDVAQRLAILRLQTKSVPLAGDVSLENLASTSHGYSGADLSAVCREATMNAITSNTNGEVQEVSMKHFQAALAIVPPSIARGYEQELAAVRWEDIGGLEGVKKRLRQAVEWPLNHEEAFKRLGLRPAKGVLLYGPPGCCKTTLARAVATGCGARLLPLSCAQVYSMYVGEGEGIVREVFRRARLSAPCIILLDEVDSIAGKRPAGERQQGGESNARLLSTLLTEMDGLELSTGLLVIAATNRPASLDPAFIRPGRLDVTLYVPPPDEIGRLQTLKIHSRDMPLALDIDLPALANSTENFTGADLAGLCREAAICSLREDVEGAQEVCQRHFKSALEGLKPSITPQDLWTYEQWGNRWKQGGKKRTEPM
ncbi:hypothetical protein BSKO_02295 [Bryopsis sp. KO-2023]|nr:hypothetical protein BSKO_02295 [Bryopsis sp. KO-2023]